MCTPAILPTGKLLVVKWKERCSKGGDVGSNPI